MNDRLVLNSVPDAPDTLGTPEAAGAPSNTGVSGEANGRASNGRFGPGNKFAAGNAFNRRLAKARQSVLDAVGSDGVTEVVKKLLAQALAGDVPSARVVLAYCVGKPAEVINPDALDAEELALLVQSPGVLEVVRAAGRVLPGVALEILGDTTAVDRDTYHREWQAAVAKLRAELDDLKKQKAGLRDDLDDDDLDDEDDDDLGDDPDPEPPTRPAA
jgi:hypothetical protein